MANLKSSEKDVRRIKRRTLINKKTKSAVRTAKKTAVLILKEANANYESVFEKINYFQSIGMRAVSKKVFKKQTISRHVSRLVMAMKRKFSQNISQ